jgi:hypothetical protein
MNPRQQLSRLVIGLTLALTPTFAAPIFGPASNLQVSGCPGNPNVPSGSLSANPVNGGAGVILSGSASVTDVTTLCMQLEWLGSMSGSVDTIADIPIAWDFTVSVTDLALPVLSSNIYIEISHQPYFISGFNQGGYTYSTSYLGTGQFTSLPNLSLNWPGPPPENPRNFTSYYVRMIVLYENTGATTQTLSIDIPSATSIDLGYLQGGPSTGVPEPATWGLIAAGLAGVAWRRRTTA